MYVILMGAQGSGKGTQAARLAPRLRLAHLATGDLFRGAIAAATPLGREVKAIYDRGELVPDRITVALVEEKLDDMAADPDVRGAVFDGFPRTLGQAEALDAALAERGEGLDRVVLIAVPRDVLVERLAGRRVCPRCGATYHVRFNPPETPGVCDRCGGELVQREDDRPEPINRRLALYFEQTEPLLDYYRRRDLLTEIDGNRPIEAVTDDIVAALGAS